MRIRSSWRIISLASNPRKDIKKQPLRISTGKSLRKKQPPWKINEAGAASYVKQLRSIKEQATFVHRTAFPQMAIKVRIKVATNNGGCEMTTTWPESHNSCSTKLTDDDKNSINSNATQPIQFVADDVRKERAPGGVSSSYARDVCQLINHLFIA